VEEFTLRDLAEFWLPATGKPWLWLRDVWVDLGLLPWPAPPSRCATGG
jgi:hypothetical protein